MLEVKQQPDVVSLSNFEALIERIGEDSADPVAVFDCDGTLWSGDSGSAFMDWSIETGLIHADAIAWLNERYRLYRAAAIDEATICGEMVQVYQGLQETDLRAAISDFFPIRIAPGIFPEMMRAVHRLQRRGVKLWAVSSTNDWVVEEGLKSFGIPPTHVLAARVEVVAGQVTNRIIDVPTGEAKVTALARVGVIRPDAVFGNSIHDAAMLAIARRPYPINPSQALLEHSAKLGWVIYQP